MYTEDLTYNLDRPPEEVSGPRYTQEEIEYRRMCAEAVKEVLG